MRRYITLLKLRPQYRYLWLASVVSFAGDWFNTIASIILVNRYTDSTTAVGLLFIARAIPPFLLSPLAGVVADRFNRKVILITTDLLRGFVVLGFLLVSITGQAWLIYVLTLAQFVISSFFQPARAAILPSLVQGRDELLTANTLSSITWSTMLALGAAAGGVVAGLFGVETAIVIDSGTFFLSAFFVWRIRVALSRCTGQVSRPGTQVSRLGTQVGLGRRQVGLIARSAFGQFGGLTPATGSDQQGGNQNHIVRKPSKHDHDSYASLCDSK